MSGKWYGMDEGQGSRRSVDGRTTGSRDANINVTVTYVRRTTLREHEVQILDVLSRHGDGSSS